MLEGDGREADAQAVHAQGSAPAPRALVLQPLTGGRPRRPVLASRASCGSASDTAPTPTTRSCSGRSTTDRVETRGHEFEQVLGDIQTLNQWARAGRLEVTALSLAAYPFVQEDYALLPHGASIGSGYGPIVVARALAVPRRARRSSRSSCRGR